MITHPQQRLCPEGPAFVLSRVYLKKMECDCNKKPRLALSLPLIRLPSCTRGQQGGGGQAHKFHTTPWGLTKEEGMTGAEEMYEVLYQIIPIELESSPSGQSSQEGALYHSQKFQWYIVHEKSQTRQLQEKAGSHLHLPIRFSIFNHHFLSTVGLGELCSIHKALQGDLLLIMGFCITNELGCLSLYSSLFPVMTSAWFAFLSVILVLL